MLRQLLIASAFLGSGLLLGSGVVILQLWTRSNLAESRIAELRSELQLAVEETQAEKVKFQEVSHRASTLESSVAHAENDRDEHLNSANQLRQRLLQVEAQNDELQTVADDAVALSNQVVELKLKLANAAAGGQPPGTSGNSNSNKISDADRSALVQVQKRPDLPDRSDPEFDDSGWRTATAARSIVQPQQVAPAAYFSEPPYSVGYPVESVIALPPY